MNPSTTPPSSTPDVVLAGAAEGAQGPPDALDALLRQIVGGYFVLTDGQGAVSKWSEPAELLFGRASEEILGQGFFETLVGGSLPPGGQAWRGFLDLGEPPQVPGTVELVGRSTDGTEFPMAAVFVPVKLDEGFDFSLFLEDLSFELPMNLMLLRMRQQHPVVVRALKQALEPEAQPWEGWRTAGTLVVFRPLSATPWIEAELARREAERAAADAEAEERLRSEDLSFELPMNLMLLRMRQQHPVVVRALKQALEPEAQPWEGWRTAGTLVVFRPLSATPWIEAELARREAERAAADAEAEERLTNPDPGIQGSFNDLDDAAAVVARLLSAMERIDELEAVAGALPAQLEEARRQADQRALAADRDAAALKADLQRALAGVPSELDRHEQQARLEKVETAVETGAARLSARVDAFERESRAADARLAESIAAAEARAAEAIAASARRAESAVDGAEIAAQIEEVRAEHEEAAHAIRA